MIEIRHAITNYHRFGTFFIVPLGTIIFTPVMLIVPLVSHTSGIHTREKEDAHYKC